KWVARSRPDEPDPDDDTVGACAYERRLGWEVNAAVRIGDRGGPGRDVGSRGWCGAAVSCLPAGCSPEVGSSQWRCPRSGAYRCQHLVRRGEVRRGRVDVEEEVAAPGLN